MPPPPPVDSLPPLVNTVERWRRSVGLSLPRCRPSEWSRSRRHAAGPQCDSGLVPARRSVAGQKRPASGAHRVATVTSLPLLLDPDLTLLDPEGPQLRGLPQ